MNQWSDPLDANCDSSVDTSDQSLVHTSMLEVVANTKISDFRHEMIDAWPFVGFHQYPPASRESKTVLGMQFNDSPAIIFISHTTHPSDIPGHVPRSELASKGVIIVRLQYWNPFYHLCGYVEVNVRKDGGVEHPMWLLADKKSKLQMGVFDMINSLFVRMCIHFTDLIQTSCSLRVL
jgi:hypothetical protein